MSEVDQFVLITGADPETARFYLQSSGDNLEVAVNNFFAEGPSTGVATVPPQQEEAPAPSSAHLAQQSHASPGTSFLRYFVFMFRIGLLESYLTFIGKRRGDCPTYFVFDQQINFLLLFPSC